MKIILQQAQGEITEKNQDLSRHYVPYSRRRMQSSSLLPAKRNTGMQGTTAALM